MAKHELWRGEAAQRYRIMEDMEQNRAEREARVLGNDDPRRPAMAARHDRAAETRAGDRGRTIVVAGPRGYQRTDERISDEVHDRLTDDRELDASEMQVTVTGGEMTLTGVVGDRGARRRAEDVAESVSGVRYVLNNIRVRQPGTAGATG